MKRIKHIITILLCVISFSGLSAQASGSDNHTVKGVVKNAETKEPLSGIRVSYRNVRSTLTDEQGKFSINLPSETVSLLVSAPSYSPKIVSVQGRTEIEIEIYDESLTSLFDELVTPRGEVSPLGLTHGWSSITEDNILSTAVTSDAILQGKVSGMNLIHRSGSLASGSNIYIRGINTMHAGTQPLFIVDGIPYENSIYSTSLLGNYFANPLTSIDSKDIESITVLKDGTSQYGAKGANGVILIRTLKANEMETRINFHYHTGINFQPSRIPVLGAADHKLLLSDVLQSRGMTGSEIMSLPYMDETKPVLQPWGYEGNVNYYRYANNTNWQDEIFTASTNQNYYMNVFGGDNVAVYALAIGYMNQQGIIKNNDFERFNTRFNAKVNLSQKFEVNANMSFLFSNRSIVDEGFSPNRNPILASLIKAPFMASHIYNPEGALSPVVEDVDVFNNSNPYALVNNSDRANSLFRFVGNFEGVYRINPYLRMNAIIGVNFNKEREKVYFPNRGVYFETSSIGEVKNITQHRVDRLLSIYSEANLNYSRTFNYVHALNLWGGMRHQSNEAEDDWAKTANTGSDSFKSISYGDPMFRTIGGQISNWKWTNLFAVADYGYLDKYFVNATIAADASSRYGREAAKMMMYPSLSAAWLISAEDFMSGVETIDYLKLRAGAGLSGNDEIGNYSGVRHYVPQSLLGNFGLVRANLVDLNLRPELSAKMSVGFDAALMNERLSVSVDLYQNRVKDMLLRIPLPRETGFPYYLTNAGEMTNTGFDITVRSRILNGPLKWDAGFVASAYRNKVTDLKGQEYITNISGAKVLTRVGESVGVFYGYKTDGVFSTQAVANAEGLYLQKGAVVHPFGAGDVRFVDQDGNKRIDEDDMVVIGNPNPDLFGSIFSTLSYKNWNLNVFFTYSLGNDIYNHTRAQLENMSGYNNQTQAVLNRWKADGDVTSMPRATYGDPMGNARFSDRWIEDGSYLRLKSLTLSYDMKLTSNIIRSSTFFVSADNLFLITGYKGLDPEFALGTSPLYKGIDATFVPHARTISLGVKLDL